MPITAPMTFIRLMHLGYAPLTAMERIAAVLLEEVCTPMAAFLQGLTTDLLLNLTYRDPESDKQIFQLLPDDETGCCFFSADNC